MNRSVVSNIPAKQYFDLPSLIKRLISLGEPINVFQFEGKWYDIGREEDYRFVLDKYAK
jgi:NDP-sugar pyrophosphorylase family protein